VRGIAGMQAARPKVYLDKAPYVEENAYGRFDCATCHKQGADGFTSRAGLGNHLPKCAMLQAWRCAWCECDRKSLGKGSVGPGPDGKGTLCQSCAR
jgi:hypothetical protein